MRDSTADVEQTRLKWNDIRIVGPLLVLVMAAAVLISPNFSGSEQSVGEVGITDPCAESAIQEAAVGAFLSDDCCDNIVSLASVGVAIDPCDEPTPVPTVQPTAVPTAQPVPEPTTAAGNPVPSRIGAPRAQVMGPTWLGPIVPDIGGTAVTLQFPDLLSVVIGDNFVHVFDDDGVLAWEGQLPKSKQITFLWPGSDHYTVKAELITNADYTEIIPAS